MIEVNGRIRKSMPTHINAITTIDVSSSLELEQEKTDIVKIIYRAKSEASTWIGVQTPSMNMSAADVYLDEGNPIKWRSVKTDSEQEEEMLMTPRTPCPPVPH